MLVGVVFDLFEIEVGDVGCEVCEFLGDFLVVVDYDFWEVGE